MYILHVVWYAYNGLVSMLKELGCMCFLSITLDNSEKYLLSCLFFVEEKLDKHLK